MKSLEAKNFKAFIMVENKAAYSFVRGKAIDKKYP